MLLIAAARGTSFTNSAVPAFEVSGVVREDSKFGKAEKVNRSFICRVEGAAWLIETTISNGAPAVTYRRGTNILGFAKAADTELVSSDGTNFYVVRRSDFARELRQEGQRSTRSRGTAAVIGPGNAPFGLNEPLLVIWYGFASQDYLRGRRSGKILPLHTVTFEDVATNNHLVSARWDQLKDFPNLPQSIQTSNYFLPASIPAELRKSGFPHTNVDFRVLEKTNFLGLTIPTRISADYFIHRWRAGSVTSIQYKHIDLTVNRLAPLTEDIGSRPPLLGPVSVRDTRYWFSNPPIPVSVRVTNRWPDNKILADLYRVRTHQASRKQAAGPRSRIILKVIVISACLIPPILAILWSVRNKHKRHNIERKV